jgi:hypothetical protein
MFVLNASEERRDTFIRTIPIDKPTADGFQQHEIKLTFRELRQSQINDIYLAMPDPKQTPDERLLKAVVVDWDGVADEDGEPLPCTPENLAALVDIPYIRKPAATIYIEVMQNNAVKDRKVKN